MLLLIDGHNLINALPDIAIDDPDDEAQLVEKLKRYSARARRKCVVVFDGGIPGGLSRELSTSQVKVIFAAAQRSSADAIIIRRIRTAPRSDDYTVITSDNEILARARERRMPALTSQAFAAQMIEALECPVEAERPDDVVLGPSEVDEWLRAFGLDPADDGE